MSYPELADILDTLAPDMGLDVMTLMPGFRILMIVL